MTATVTTLPPPHAVTACLQVEQALKLCRFLAALHGASATRAEAGAAVALIVEALPSMALQEDKLIALAEAADVRGRAAAVRCRAVLLRLSCMLLVSVWRC